MQFLYALGSIMTEIIWGFAAIEVLLIISLFWSLRTRSIHLRDCLKNILRGVKVTALAKDSGRSFMDEVAALANSISQTLQNENSEDAQTILRNIQTQNVHQVAVKTQSIENRFNISNAIIGSLPLLGVLGTVLPLGTAISNETSETLQASIVLTSFGLAISSTGLGLLFTIIFMVCEARFTSPFHKFREQLNIYKKILETYALFFKYRKK